ncbi:hypothetical protein ACFL37_02170 [Candidatus Margulisiibacteriota bacterium]
MRVEIKPTARIYPKYFKKVRSAVQDMSSFQRLSAVGRLSNKITPGERRAVLGIVALAIGSDYEPMVLTAAREALSSIETIDFGRYSPLEELGFSRMGSHHMAPFYLGALFELLPLCAGTQAFEELFPFHERDMYVKTGDYAKGGRTMLRFNNSQSAAGFYTALREMNGPLAAKLKKKIQNKEVRTYEYRRYEAGNLLRNL